MLSNRLAVALIGLLAAVGAVDAAIGGQADLAVLQAVVVMLSASVLLRAVVPSRMVPVRGDLARWLDQRAADGTEEAGDVANRAIALYRAGLTGAIERRDG